MGTLEFFRKILPEQGFYVLTVFENGMKMPPEQEVCTTLTQLAERATQADQKGYPTFHACASYLNKEGVWCDKKEKMRVRIVANTAFVRAQWLDVDVGPGKDYATRKEALTAIRDMCKTLGIPAPIFVGSGSTGLHLYWPFNRDVDSGTAALQAEAFSKALKSVGFRHDTTRTKDMASILRPVGTHNRKAAPVEVQLLRDAPAIDPDQFWAKFSRFKLPAPLQIKGLQSDWGSGVKEFAPSSVKQIVRKCPALYDVAKAKGDVVEPLWRAMLGLVKHTVEGEKQCHTWSKGYAHYSQSETQNKIDSWVHGPTTCEVFSRDSDRCNVCPHRDKISSPISLGYSADAPPPVKPSKTSALINQPVDHYSSLIPNGQAATPNIPFWPKGYSWNGEQLMVFKRDKDGGGEWVAFSDTLYYPFLRYETEEWTRAMKVCALTDPHKDQWRVFDLDTTKVADARTLASALGAQEIVYMPQSKERNMKFVQDVLHGIRDYGIETTTYSTYGWHGGGYVLGDTLLLPKGDQPVFLGSKVPDDLRGCFGLAGSALEWAAGIDLIYNRPGAEAYQFIICAAFASALVKLCETDMWHGIPCALTGPGGLGKTTTCKVAVSAFGDPRKMTIQANDEGTTMNALIQRVGTMRNTPMVLDEITGRDTAELQSMLFALSNGKPKLRLRPDGTEINPGQSWDVITFITGNLSITKMLADSDRVKADATQVRCFEIPLDEDFNNRVFHGINAKDLIEHKLLNSQYGHAGREFLRYVIKHKAQITKELQKQRAAFAATDSTESRERFYYDLIATTLVAASICRKLHLINFDIGRLRKWALGHVSYMRTVRSHSLDTPEDYLQGFLSYLYQHTVITKYYRDGREKLPTADNVIPSYKEPLARHATEDRRFIVTLKAFNQWCSTQKVTPHWLRGQLEKQAYIVESPDGERQRICKGTGMDGVQARCIEFDYDLLDNKKLVLPEYIHGVVKNAD